MTNLASKFRIAILCEDIRDEVGDKKSLMGVMTGDIVLGSLPSMLQIAFFLEYAPNSAQEAEVSFVFRLMQDENEVLKAGMTAKIPAGHSANLILPRGLMRVDKECVFGLRVSVNDGPEEEILKKRIFAQTPVVS